MRDSIFIAGKHIVSAVTCTLILHDQSLLANRVVYKYGLFCHDINIAPEKVIRWGSGNDDMRGSRGAQPPPPPPALEKT